MYGITLSYRPSGEEVHLSPKANEIDMKTVIDAECRLLGAKQTCRGHGWNFSY